jgi:hypothetical protein
MSVGIPDAHLDAGTFLPSLLTSSARLGDAPIHSFLGILVWKGPIRFLCGKGLGLGYMKRISTTSSRFSFITFLTFPP